jgi:hypothetical protein
LAYPIDSQIAELIIPGDQLLGLPFWLQKCLGAYPDLLGDIVSGAFAPVLANHSKSLSLFGAGRDPGCLKRFDLSPRSVGHHGKSTPRRLRIHVDGLSALLILAGNGRTVSEVRGVKSGGASANGFRRALSIETFEVSRWRLRRARDLWDLNRFSATRARFFDGESRC